MKTPLNWISLYTDISELIETKGTIELAHLYSIHTAEIDGTQEFLSEKKVVVGKVIEAHKHPDSDHLNIVQVDLGVLGKTQIVCGASNVLESKYVPVATIGTIIKGEFEIKSTRLRGEESNGMICSEDELELQEGRSAGIMRLEDYFDEKVLENHIGKPFGDLETKIIGLDGKECETKLNDIVFEIDNKFITNRPDLFSIEGNAREFGAIFDLPFNGYSKTYNFSQNKLNTKIETDKVLAYNLIKVEGVQSGVSPFGISYMLYKSGINPKFDLVDMTNYIMTELGQPMHAFDADKIKGGITVRLAKSGEKMLALNGETYELNSTDIVIADDEKVLAIGGIIGGLESAISETTTNIYIESACFDASNIRLTAQRLGVRTDSSTRYEKSQDPLLTNKALARAMDFLSFIGKPGKIVGDSEYLDMTQVNNVSINFTEDFINKKIGVKIPGHEIERILKA
ncbi:MAG: phenylalanine--tRNA ligase subunit beta, partial [Candidatus Gracilibacteria bacterium]|nr:phenylalanine--tRNA ligase subunit beta [Candidatus Gracilibacteria bacterium]